MDKTFGLVSESLQLWRYRARYKGLKQGEQESALKRFVSAVKQCTKTRDFDRGKRLHSDAVAGRFHNNKYVAAAFISMYAKCGSIQRAREVFDNTSDRDVVTWTSVILGYVENGESSVAMELFERMDCEPDSFAYCAVLKACAAEKKVFLEKGMAIHEQVRIRGLDSDLVMATALVDMYCKSGCMHLAQEVFDRMARKDVVTWTCLIMGYVENGENLVAMELFAKMDCDPTYVSYVAVVKACARLEEGTSIHEQIKQRGFESQIRVASALIDMYGKCGSMYHASEVFKGMPRQDLVAWNSLLMGYVENGESSRALDMFVEMECEPDCYTYVAVLKACVCLAALPYGNWIHSRLCVHGYEEDQVVANTLVDLYGKCGSIAKAELLLNSMYSPDTVSWNALISGYTSLGDSKQVFLNVKKMQQAGLETDRVTCICYLTACSHAGLVEQGKNYFKNMSKYGVKPSLEHYNCVVDMLGRANRLEEALHIINSMPYEGNSYTWTSLLGACRKWKNLEVGKVAFDALVDLDKENAAAYVLMGDIHLNPKPKPPLELRKFEP